MMRAIYKSAKIDFPANGAHRTNLSKGGKVQAVLEFLYPT